MGFTTVGGGLTKGRKQMSDQGALNKFEHGEWAAGFHDIVVSVDNLFNTVKTDAEQDAALALKTFVSQFATPFGQQALALAGTVLTDVTEGQTVPQIAASVTPQISQDILTDAESAGVDTAQVVLNAARVQLSNAVNAPASAAAAPAEPTPTPGL
jgi:hypothetical protein